MRPSPPLNFVQVESLTLNHTIVIYTQAITFLITGSVELLYKLSKSPTVYPGWGNPQTVSVNQNITDVVGNGDGYGDLNSNSTEP